MHQNDDIEQIEEKQGYNLLENNPYSKILIKSENLENIQTDYGKIRYLKQEFLIVKNEYENAKNIDKCSRYIILYNILNILLTIFLIIYGGKYSLLYLITIIPQIMSIFYAYKFNYSFMNKFLYYVFIISIARIILAILYIVKTNNINFYSIVLSWILLLIEINLWMRINTFCSIFMYYKQNVSSNLGLINSESNVMDTQFEDIMNENNITNINKSLL